ncbi:hypothetical protein BV25DRAFT_1920106 [Artomyces pyxidatus]|uniref:Uncharacterized protein n=1 Tax=Artomyces pyxidatus TaxID=48021 RepID=A0ACB8SMP8_9AGAM|nr:hypothetical protein BV25DRAFT_1920106 [Artomyces pyxidatus]
MQLGAGGPVIGCRGAHDLFKTILGLMAVVDLLSSVPSSPFNMAPSDPHDCSDRNSDAAESAPPPPPSPNPTEPAVPPPNPGGRWYVVFAGRRPGIYNDWHTAARYVIGVPNSVYKKYRDYEAALADFNASQEASQANVAGANDNTTHSGARDHLDNHAIDDREHDEDIAARMARMNMGGQRAPSIDSISVSFNPAHHAERPGSHVHVDLSTRSNPPPYSLCSRHRAPTHQAGINVGRGHAASPTPAPATNVSDGDAALSAGYGYDMSSGPSRHSPEGGSLYAPLRPLTPVQARAGNGHPYFVVLNARQNGIFNAPWNVVSMLVVSRPRAIWRSFRTLEEASAWYWEQLAEEE